jgi:hypothetical protein
MGKGSAKLRSPHRKLHPDTKGRIMKPTSLRGRATKAASDKAHRFRNLFGLLSVGYLRWCWRFVNLRATSGVDRKDARSDRENRHENIEGLVQAVQGGWYRSKLVLRKYIPKLNGKLRPLGIPATADKLLQIGVTQILEAIYEADFLDCSYGYRPGIGALDAIGALSAVLRSGRYHYRVEADIRSFFDTIDHEKLIERLALRSDDKAFLRLIRKGLKAGILEPEGAVQYPERGSPQGGSVSPILANIYLHYALDIGFEETVQAPCQGAGYRCRYADDCAPRRRTGGREPSVQPCCTRDGGRSPEAAVQAEASNHPLLLPLREAVVRELGKGRARPGQVRTVESNASEPLMTCRKRRNGVKTGGESLLRDQSGGNLLTAQAASGMKVARMRSRLLCGTWEPVIPMPRERRKRKPLERLSTDAGYRGGATWSSEEGPVMGLERRGCPIRPKTRRQPALGGLS